MRVHIHTGGRECWFGSTALKHFIVWKGFQAISHQTFFVRWGGHQKSSKAHSAHFAGPQAVNHVCSSVACACSVSVPALALLGPEHIIVQGLHEHVLCSLLDLTQVHLADAHHVLLIGESLVSEFLFCLTPVGFVEVVNSDDLVSKAFIPQTVYCWGFSML